MPNLANIPIAQCPGILCFLQLLSPLSLCFQTLLKFVSLSLMLDQWISTFCLLFLLSSKYLSSTVFKILIQLSCAHMRSSRYKCTCQNAILKAILFIAFLAIYCFPLIVIRFRNLPFMYVRKYIIFRFFKPGPNILTRHYTVEKYAEYQTNFILFLLNNDNIK